MSFLEDPEVKKTYDKCKYMVKIWEHKFTKKYKRIPSKLDIREAPVEVRHAYRKYFQLKTAALEESFMDVEGLEDEDPCESFSQGLENCSVEPETMSQLQLSNDNFTELVPEDSSERNDDESSVPVSEEQHSDNQAPDYVWGCHLNKQKSPSRSENQKEKGPSEPVQSITKKLFCGSKFNKLKRNPRKSLSFTQKKNTESSFESPSFFSQPEPVMGSFQSEEAIQRLGAQVQNSFFSKTIGTTESVKQCFSQSVPVNIVDSVLDQRGRQNLRKVDTGWLKRITENTGIPLEDSELPQSFSGRINSSIFSRQRVQALDTKVDYDSDEIIGDSDEEQNTSNISAFHVAKKSRICFEPKTPSFNSPIIPLQPSQKETVTNELSSSISSSLKENITNNIPEIKIDANISEKLVEHITNVPETIEKPIEESLDKLEALKIHEKTPKKAQRKPVKRQISKKTPKKTKQSAKKKVAVTPDSHDSTEESPSVRRSTRKNKVKASFEELSSGEEDPFASDNDDQDPEFVLDKEEAAKNVFDFKEIEEEFDKSTEDVIRKKKKGRKKFDKPMDKEDEEEFNKSTEDKKNKKGRKKSDKPLDTSKDTPVKGKRTRQYHKPKEEIEQKSEEPQGSEPGGKYELEYNVKPRIVAPRYSSIKAVIREKLKLGHSKESDQPTQRSEGDKSLSKDKRQQAKEKLEMKVASGGLNDNYVTINLRKKIFARGKKGHNFSKYKKAMWKSKKKALYGPDMDMGGCDGGKLICFNCGKEGHFAQRCKEQKGDGLLPIAAEDEEECPFPTLEEATQMASDSYLTIRKPKLLVSKEKDKKNENRDSEKGDSNNEDEHTANKKLINANVKDDAKSKELPSDNDKVDTESKELPSDEDDTESKAEEDNTSSDEEWMEEIEDDVLLAEVIKLEDHVKKLDVQEYLDNVQVVKPYYELKEDGNVIDTPKEVYQTLEMFGHKSFRAGQEKAVMRILSGKSTLVTLSTGSGKSLCYQLPAYLFSRREPCISLVISPLVSLMEDQVIGIPKFLKAACLHTNQTEAHRKKIMEAISTGDLNVLLISPEAVVAGEKKTGFGSLFRQLPPIAFACIDEAHCVSQWSHNFRPSYLMICRVLRESLGVRTILGLTATATRATCDSIVKSLDIPDGVAGIISDIPLPDNLHLTVSKDANRDRALLNLLLSDRFKQCKSIIVYCTRREECERMASFLRTSLKSEIVVESTNKKRKRLNLQAEPYHAGLSASRRRTVQNAFMSGELRVVVATVAFGMGINKSDIRAVIHFNMPNSFESYVQEVGRAGRDGLPAHCHLFLDSQGRDENELRRHIHANSIDRHVIRKLLQKIFIPCSCKGVCPKHEVAFSIEQTVRSLDIPEENISTLLCYLELHENKYIELLNPGYTMCKIISYGGPLQIRKAAKDCPPLTMALALYPSKEREDNVIEFPVIDAASAMGWDSGICKHKLKNLEWTTVNNQPKRSTLTVQFSNLGFRLLAPGNLSDEQLDEALDNLFFRVQSQETKAQKQLHAVHKTMLGVAEKTYNACVAVAEDNSDNAALKDRIREYFNSADPLANLDTGATKEVVEAQVINDVRAMICMYRDNQFTGRALARIFHGIQSPNYPAVIWGRCKFWRSHLNEHFHEICRIATKEIIRMR